MSEMKFKNYSELEVAESLSDAARVLIEEAGEVKRFPAKSVGGSAKAVIRAVVDESDYSTNYELTSGSYAELASAVANGELPDIILNAVGVGSGISRATNANDFGDSMQVTFYHAGMGLTLVINSDNTVNEWEPV